MHEKAEAGREALERIEGAGNLKESERRSVILMTLERVAKMYTALYHDQNMNYESSKIIIIHLIHCGDV